MDTVDWTRQLLKKALFHVEEAASMSELDADAQLATDIKEFLGSSRKVLYFSMACLPQAKERPQIRKPGSVGKRVFTPKNTAKYEEYVKGLALEAMRDMRELKPVECPVTVEIAIGIHPPRKFSKKQHVRALTGEISPTGRPDLDNMAKSILDAMNETVYVDDKQVIGLMVRKYYAHADFTSIRVEWKAWEKSLSG